MSQVLGVDPQLEPNLLPSLPRETQSDREVSAKPKTIVIVDSDEGDEDLRAAFRQLEPAWTLKFHPYGREAMRAIVLARPAAVLMEVGEPQLPGIECARRLKAMLPSLPVVMLTAQADVVSIFLSIMAGVSGYLIKPVALETVVSTLARAIRGGTGVMLCDKSQSHLMNYVRSLCNPRSALLTPREQQIMGCLFQNMTNKEIAEQLHIKPSTLHAELEALYRKLQAHCRQEAIRKYLGLDPTSLSC